MPPSTTTTKVQPKITAEGERAKANIAAARAKKNAGTITPSDLTPTPLMKVTPPAPSTAGAALTGTIDSFTQGLQTTTDAAKTSLDTSRTDYTNAVTNRQSKSALQLQADEANGVNAANDSLNSINEQILAQKNALNQQTQAIMNAGGKSKAQAQAQINNITREANANLANLSITQFVAQNRYDSAKAIADRAVDAQFDQDQKQIDALKFTYEDNRDLFTTAEQRLFETKLEDRRTAIETQREQAKTLQNTKLESMRMAQLNGAPTSVLQAIQAATTAEDVISAGGQYGSVDMLDREAKLASIANTYDQIASRAEQNKAMYGTLNGKAQTDTERVSELYANRMLEANAVIAQNGSKFASLSSIAGQYSPNFLKSSDRQMFEQAQRNFINAVLRKESGAVIAKEEFDNARLQYFPQPGDSIQVLEQKAQNRNTAVAGLYNAANVPMPELVKATDTTPLKSGHKGVTTSGLTFTVE